MGICQILSDYHRISPLFSKEAPIQSPSFLKRG